MKFLRLLCALLVAISFSGAAQKIDPITKAVLDGYTEYLKENPKDFETYFDRGAQYYQLGHYEQALEDLTQALQYTPQKNTDMRQRELTLISSIAASMNNYELALKAVQDALELAPQDYGNIYRKGLVLLNLNRPEEAYRAFSSLQSLKSRSQDAYYGMAKACIRQGNISEAETLMKEVEAAAPTNPATFTRIGDLFMDMNQPENAAANYIVAMTMGDRTSNSMQSLLNLASSNYKAAASALDYAAEKSENKQMMLFLKGTIALESGNYADAEVAFNRLLELPDSKIAGVYNSLAKARRAQNLLPDAMEAVNQAISMQPDADNYTLKSEIELAMGNTRGAVADAAEALRIAPDNADALLASAKAYIGAEDADNAIPVLNSLIMQAPDNMQALLLRAYVNQEMKKNAKSATPDFNRIILEQPASFPDITVRALAQSKSGKKLDADAGINEALATNPTPSDLYWGAVYFAQTGDLERAKALVDQARYDGFQNTLLLTDTSTPWLNLKPIQHLLK
ncbi:MAG: tetratricopeptide repeat protein [Muribaculaceae bacterium]|nr:tetratricopeptide repeat protein [Muribaculaceae bacterium]